MKITTISLALLSAFSFCHAQNPGSITSTETKPKAGSEIHYVYSPPNRLLIPDKTVVSVVYQSEKQFYVKKIPINKDGNGYGFSFKAPDSSAVLVFSMEDANKKIVDNNNEEGYILYLNDKNGNRFSFEKISLAGMLSGYAQYFLKLKETPKTLLIKMYEDSYMLHPELKQKDSYLDYLTVLYKEKQDAVKPKMLAYAKQMALTQNNEAKLSNAIRVYRLLKMDEEQQVIEQKTIANYPNGQIAKDKFWDKFNSAENPTEQSVVAFMDEYVSRFQDSSINVMDNFYMTILFSLLKNKEWNGLKKYELLIHNKLNVAGLYNNFAWKLSGEQIDNPGNDLDIAKMLSRKSLDYTGELMKTPGTDDQQSRPFQGNYNTHADTYALILYKLGQYDSAFYYQDEIYKQGSELDAGGLERYAVYAEKVKGIKYAKQVIEKQLLVGLNSPIMLKQLQSIYKQLSLPADEFNKLQEKSNFLAKQKTAETIKAKFGTVKAKNFALKNIFGETVPLSSLKNKVVVLDFWATWCMPCRASFPAMQALLNKYKEDSSVVFLFIDVWERKSPEKMQESAVKFIKDNNYSFNVLLDVHDKVVNEYRVEGIPSKFVIDKKGNIVFMGDSSNLSLEIENAKN